MALPSSGPLSIGDIKTELGSSSGSLRTLSAAAGKSTPDAISEFYGYQPLLVDYLVVAGGGAGGFSSFTNQTFPAGGGGAGGLRTSYGTTSGGGASSETQISLQTGTNYSVTIGGGGTGNSSVYSDGSNSVFHTITSIGGGRGRGYVNNTFTAVPSRSERAHV